MGNWFDFREEELAEHLPGVNYQLAWTTNKAFSYYSGHELANILREYGKTHPIKPADLSDWLFLVDAQDPLLDTDSFLQDLGGSLNPGTSNAAVKLANKAGEIGAFLTRLVELERRSNVLCPPR